MKRKEVRDLLYKLLLIVPRWSEVFGFLSYSIFISVNIVKYVPRLSEASPSTHSDWCARVSRHSHATTGYASHIFQVHLWINTLMYSILPDRAMTTSCTALHMLLLNFGHVFVSNKRDERARRIMKTSDDIGARRSGLGNSGLGSRHSATQNRGLGSALGDFQT